MTGGRKRRSPAQLAYAKLLAELTRSVFHEAGFRRRGNAWTLETPACWQVVQFQSSAAMGSSHEVVVFTVNVSVASKRLLESQGVDPGVPPQEPRCHLRQRIGQLLPYIGRDHWWPLGGESEITAVRMELSRTLVWHAFPWLRRNARTRH